MATILEYYDSAFYPGFQFRFTEVDNEERWRQWYNSDFSTLVPQGTVDNGLQLLPRGVTAIPLFQFVSDFSAEAAYADGPSYSTNVPAIDAWLQENYYKIDKALQRAVRYWSICDVAVLVASDDKVEAIDPIHYFRVGSPDQPDELIGHIIASRYVDRSFQEQLQPTYQRTPNRIKVIKFRDGVGFEQTFVYHPDIVGQPVTPLTMSLIKAICVSGSWNSWYGGIKELAAQLLITHSVHSAQLNRYANRATYLPIETLDAIRDSVPPGEARLSAQAAAKAFSEMTRPVVGITQSEDGSYNVPPESIYSEDFQSREMHLDRLWDIFYLASGASPQSYGVGVGKGESGFAREKAQDAAAARVRAFRRDMAECLPKVCRAMGCPDGDITFNWSAPPFQSHSAHVDEIVRLYEKGIIDVNESRRALGYNTDKQEPEQQQRQEPAVAPQPNQQAQIAQGGNR